MKLHEYQSKELLKRFNLNISTGLMVDKTEIIKEAINEVSSLYNTSTGVIKAQIHAGGRGKGGGVKLASNKQDAFEKAKNIYSRKGAKNAKVKCIFCCFK